MKLKMQNPLSGTKQDVSVKGFGELVLGVVVILAGIAIGEKAYGAITGRTKWLGNPHDPFVTQKTQVPAPQVPVI